MPSPSSAAVGVVTVSYNSSAVLGPFLDSARSSRHPDVVIIVVDNGSSDVAISRELCGRHGATLLELDDNLGYGGAINRGIAALPASIMSVLVSNPDVVLGQKSIGILEATLAAHSDAGAVGPQVHNLDGSIYPSARRLPSLRSGFGHAVFGRIWPSNPWTARYFSDTSRATELERTGWLSGSCLMVRRSAFDEIHGFDERFFMYFEDVDLGYRLGKSGWTSYFEPAASVIHTGAHSTKSESRRMISAHHRSASLYLQRKYAAWYLFPLRWSIRLGLAIRSGWLQRSGGPA
ncbi:MAG TPA: glycosyltransferase family 2 protein [Pseudolysinimonas sp.]